ncbi:glucuronoxylan 4-O-methyltransferase 1-like [Curcuma longa]|uniref:glucuronoxylan 4-O-methyltransferase 1-like n=1 Tax=Curcuma longa TaxID=136217 RepID=UPI003D9F3DF9
MKPKSSKNALKTKLLLFGFVLAVFLFFYFLTSSNYSSSSVVNRSPASGAERDGCAKIPPSLAHSIIHYATLNITPQQTLEEVSVTARVLEKRSPCNFLVFGLGHDSLMWSALNHGGRTVFLEEDKQWIARVTKKFPSLEAYHVRYSTKVREAEELMEKGKSSDCTGAVAEELGGGDAPSSIPSSCTLALTDLPSAFYEVEWDVIMVDAPTGYVAEAPGRMGAIYTAGMAGRGRSAGGTTDVMVHDVNRQVEDRFSMAFLCGGYMKEEVGKLRHFTIPSHRGGPAVKFCP